MKKIKDLKSKNQEDENSLIHRLNTIDTPSFEENIPEKIETFPEEINTIVEEPRAPTDEPIFLESPDIVSYLQKQVYREMYGTENPSDYEKQLSALKKYL